MLLFCDACQLTETPYRHVLWCMLLHRQNQPALAHICEFLPRLLHAVLLGHNICQIPARQHAGLMGSSSCATTYISQQVGLEHSQLTAQLCQYCMQPSLQGITKDLLEDTSQGLTAVFAAAGNTPAPLLTSSKKAHAIPASGKNLHKQEQLARCGHALHQVCCSYV